MQTRWLKLAIPLFFVAAAAAVTRIEPLRQALLPPEPPGEAMLRKVIPDLRIDADSLDSALEQLGKQAGTTIQYSRRDFDPAGEREDLFTQPIAFELRNATLSEALDTVFPRYFTRIGDYYVDDGKVIVTPWRGVHTERGLHGGPILLRLYDVRDVVPSFKLMRPFVASGFQNVQAQIDGVGTGGTVTEAVIYELSDVGESATVYSSGRYIVVRGTTRQQMVVSRMVATFRAASRDGTKSR